MANNTGFTIWFTGLSGSGKSTLSDIIEQRLKERGRNVEVLDGDIVRTHLSKGLGFSREDRDINIKRIAFVCGLLTRNGVVSIAAAISPYREAREWARSEIGNFVEIYVKCPVEVCRQRDVRMSGWLWILTLMIIAAASAISTSVAQNQRKIFRKRLRITFIAPAPSQAGYRRTRPHEYS